MMGGPVGAHLLQQVCQEEQEVSLAGPELSQDPWTDACWQTGTTCGWASPARCHHFLCRAGDITGLKSSLRLNVSSNTPNRFSALTPLHWPLGVVGCCSAGETSFMETKKQKESECHCALRPQKKKLRKSSLDLSIIVWGLSSVTITKIIIQKKVAVEIFYIMFYFNIWMFIIQHNLLLLAQTILNITWVM